ncbi:MAG: cytochrome c biogenesis CcdA family protein [Mycobacteriales bacterium]
MLLALAVAFGNGVISFAAPCTVPLLPAYLGVLSGASAGVPPERRAGRLVVGALLYVAGFSLVFVALGVLAGSAGRAVRVVGGPAQRAGGVLVLVTAMLMLAEARTGWLSRLAAGDRGRSRLARSGSLWAPFGLGAVFGTAFTPCVGPFLATALAIAANGADGTRGGIILFAYALGIGVPFVLAAMGVASSERAGRRLARSSGTLSYVAAGVLGVLGLLLVTGRYGVLSGWLAKLVVVSST